MINVVSEGCELGVKYLSLMFALEEVLWSNRGFMIRPCLFSRPYIYTLKGYVPTRTS